MRFLAGRLRQLSEGFSQPGEPLAGLEARPVPLRVATAKLKLVTADDYGVMTARTLDVSFGD